MRDLYLIRHGKPQYPDEHSYCIGQTDLPLSMLGHLQAVLLHEELSIRSLQYTAVRYQGLSIQPVI